jgi:hypothetical protein
MLCTHMAQRSCISGRNGKPGDFVRPIGSAVGCGSLPYVRPPRADQSRALRHRLKKLVEPQATQYCAIIPFPMPRLSYPRNLIPPYLPRYPCLKDISSSSMLRHPPRSSATRSHKSSPLPPHLINDDPTPETPCSLLYRPPDRAYVPRSHLPRPELTIASSPPRLPMLP